MKKGISTLEWIVIAAIALVMITYVLSTWGNVWTPAAAKLTSASSDFQSALSGL